MVLRVFVNVQVADQFGRFCSELQYVLHVIYELYWTVQATEMSSLSIVFLTLVIIIVANKMNG